MKQDDFSEFQIVAVAAFQWFANHGFSCGYRPNLSSAQVKAAGQQRRRLDDNY